MIYELRTYRIHPSKLRDFLSVTAKVGITLRVKYSKLTGYWTTEIGSARRSSS
jgi:hypothetical protein